MDLKLFLTVFMTVFLAELGDKTQLATVLFASRSSGGRWVVFAAASLALVLAAGLGVLAGDWLSRNVPEAWLHRVAGAGFVAIGVWVFARS